MISIHSRLENAFLISKVSQKRRFWTGALRDKEHINVFEWSDGSAWNFWNWNTGEPFESLEENCVIFAAGRWSVDRCDAKHSQICQKAVQSSKSSDEADTANSVSVLKEQMNEVMRQVMEIKEMTKNNKQSNMLVIMATTYFKGTNKGLFKIGSINDSENL
ncbi:macrophage mannose receptor 1-like protein [Leptotrombidium deliense]|uniref:Macrophage mannose receptor 1-like protein n=1 Tax=Leptotrombidium deliense TaxID=299467 RepID=A0A443S1Q4_9ACAR|nr:macrophage mannose receptor 1-like protein [Leptotrombidium deliense]